MSHSAFNLRAWSGWAASSSSLVSTGLDGAWLIFLRDSARDECGRLVAQYGGFAPYPTVAEKDPCCGIRDDVEAGLEYADERVFPRLWPFAGDMAGRAAGFDAGLFSAGDCGAAVRVCGGGFSAPVSVEPEQLPDSMDVRGCGIKDCGCGINDLELASEGFISLG